MFGLPLIEPHFVVMDGMTKRNEPSPSMYYVLTSALFVRTDSAPTDQIRKEQTTEPQRFCMFLIAFLSAPWMATGNTGNLAGCPLRSMCRWMEYAESISPVWKVAIVEVVWRKWLSSASLVSPRWRVWVPQLVWKRPTICRHATEPMIITGISATAGSCVCDYQAIFLGSKCPNMHRQAAGHALKWLSRGEIKLLARADLKSLRYKALNLPVG